MKSTPNVPSLERPDGRELSGGAYKVSRGADPPVTEPCPPSTVLGPVSELGQISPLVRA